MVRSAGKQMLLDLAASPVDNLVPARLFFFSGGIGESYRQSFSGEVAAEEPERGDG